MPVMKTTIEVADGLLARAKKYAAAHGMTLRDVVEFGLRSVLGAQRAELRPFRLKRCAFKGSGLASEYDWAGVRDKIYEGRGA
jgi:hypothetical protein